jgi:hypothetical protein
MRISVCPSTFSTDADLKNAVSQREESGEINIKRRGEYIGMKREEIQY